MKMSGMLTTRILSHSVMTLLNIAYFRMLHLVEISQIFVCPCVSFDGNGVTGIRKLNWRTGTRNMDEELGPRNILVERGTRTLNMDLEPGLQDKDLEPGLHNSIKWMVEQFVFVISWS